MPVRTRERIERLQARIEAESMIEVIRVALALYEQLWEAADKGKELVLRTKGSADQIVFLKPR